MDLHMYQQLLLTHSSASLPTRTLGIHLTHLYLPPSVPPSLSKATLGTLLEAVADFGFSLS